MSIDSSFLLVAGGSYPTMQLQWRRPQAAFYSSFALFAGEKRGQK
jgi:hypothetical protein